MRKAVLVLASVALAMLLVSGVAWAAKIRCERGSTQNKPCHGTKNPDLIRGTIGRDYVIGYPGGDWRYLGFTDHDTIYGFARNDHLKGGQGRDRLYGGSGNDFIDGGYRADKIRGGGGDDYLSVGDGGGTGDWMSGGPGNDVMDGWHIQDTLFGGRGADVLSGSWSEDHLYGDAGPDTIYSRDGAISGAGFDPDLDERDVVKCGDGVDKVFADDEGVDEIAADCEQIDYEIPESE